METISAAEYNNLIERNTSETVKCIHFAAELNFLIQNKKYIKAKYFIYAHLDNGQRSGKEVQRIIAGKRAKKMGVLKGIADYMFIWGDDPNSKQFGFIEFKAYRGVLSEEQKQFQGFCNILNVPYVIVRKKSKAIETLKQWGVISENYNSF